jgi:anti-sigma B factor antagonist
MTINKTQDGSALVVALEGRLDTTTAPELEQELKNSLDGVTDLTLDLAKLDYISSAGLRVLLSAHKTMMKQGQMKVTNASEIVKEVFEVTGFCDILNIE